MEVNMTTVQRELGKQEEIIAGCMEDFVRLGMAMKVIRERRLYLADGHQTFKDYCKERWDYTESYSSQIISSATLRLALPTPDKRKVNATSTAWTEFTVRPLKRLGSTTKAKAVAKRILVEVEMDGVKLTSALVAKHVNEALGIKRNSVSRPKPMFDDVLRQWTGDIIGMAEQIEKVPADALKHFGRTQHQKAKALASAIERLERSLTRVWESLP